MSQKTDYIIYNFDAFPPVHTVITLPKKNILYRGFDSAYGPITKLGAFFTSNLDYATSYSVKSQVGTFALTRPLRLYDIRYIKTLLYEIFAQQNPVQSQNPRVFHLVNTLSLCLGMCSYEKQMELVAQRYAQSPLKSSFIQSMEAWKGRQWPQNFCKNVVELQGVRIAETTNDRQAMVYLKDIFSNVIDGFIAPKMFSPFHFERDNLFIESEVHLFSPMTSGIVQLNQDVSHIRHTPIDNLFEHRLQLTQFQDGSVVWQNSCDNQTGGGLKKMANHHADTHYLKHPKQHEKMKLKAKKAVDILLNRKPVVSHHWDLYDSMSKKEYDTLGHVPPNSAGYVVNF